MSPPKMVHEWIQERARRIAWQRLAERLHVEAHGTRPVQLVEMKDVDCARREIEMLITPRPKEPTT